MDEKCRVLIGLGAATAANCVPCFAYYYDKALAVKLRDEEIQEAVELGNQMKAGAQMTLRNSISKIMGGGKRNDTPCSGSASEVSCCN